MMDAGEMDIGNMNSGEKARTPSPFSLFRFPFSIFLLCAAAACVLVQPQGPPAERDFTRLREAMVRDQIAADRGFGAEPVRDPRVLDAMRRVPRHKFVPPEQIPYAYEDHPLPIGYGQTISQPYIVAKMTEVVEPKKNHRALEIGTGSGYQAAILAELVSEVYTIELLQPLGEEARQRLRSLGSKNVEVRIGDGYAGWPEKAPFDVIVVTAGAPSIPPALVQQLRPGGRMVIPVGEAGEVQILKLVAKVGKGPDDFTVQDLMPVRFVPLVRETKKN